MSRSCYGETIECPACRADSGQKPLGVTGVTECTLCHTRFHWSARPSEYYGRIYNSWIETYYKSYKIIGTEVYDKNNKLIMEVDKNTALMSPDIILTFNGAIDQKEMIKLLIDRIWEEKLQKNKNFS
jgi:transcription elongation factor Elf1